MESLDKHNVLNCKIFTEVFIIMHQYSIEFAITGHFETVNRAKFNVFFINSKLLFYTNGDNYVLYYTD